MRKHEIERKFLLDKEVLNLEKYQKIQIVQGYISLEPVVRIRKAGDFYYLTKKGKGLMIKEEVEEEISKQDFLTYSRKIIGNCIEKTRYFLPLDNDLIATLDIFSKQLLGLKIIEVEFSSLKAANDFIKPDWFGEEVTYNKDYYNVNLIFK
jgi:CYTH domain-containing protein